MRKRKCNRTLKKRAVVAGLFLGMLCTFFGCVRPAVQPTGTPEPTKEISGSVTQSPIGETTPVPTATQLPEGPTGQVLPKPTPETVTPIGRPTPALPTGEPDISPTPVTGGAVSVTPEVTQKPTSTPEPTLTPEPTPEPTPELTLTPEPTPELTLTPEPTPELTLTPEPTPEPTPTQEPTTGIRPDYETLLQNGWQRTEDFFGRKEIYFSGMFKQTELLTAPGRYEYRYTTRTDETAVFSVIGEELPVQSFLDELTQKGTNCVITGEAEDDYSYQYTEKECTVSGRVYACVAEGKECRMRIEISYPTSTGQQREQYEFYLK